MQAPERNHNLEVRNIRAALLSRAGWKQREIGEELNAPRQTVQKILAHFSEGARNELPDPDLIDEAAAPYDESILEAAEQWKKEIAELLRASVCSRAPARELSHH